MHTTVRCVFCLRGSSRCDIIHICPMNMQNAKVNTEQQQLERAMSVFKMNGNM